MEKNVGIKLNLFYMNNSLHDFIICVSMGISLVPYLCPCSGYLWQSCNTCSMNPQEYIQLYWKNCIKYECISGISQYFNFLWSQLITFSWSTHNKLNKSQLGKFSWSSHNKSNKSQLGKFSWSSHNKLNKSQLIKLSRSLIYTLRCL